MIGNVGGIPQSFGEKQGLRGPRPRGVQMCVSHSVIHASVGAACPSRYRVIQKSYRSYLVAIHKFWLMGSSAALSPSQHA